ncbi:PREDICTED: nuclear pore complex protein NUP1 isoform X2 [Tarenaya hassleriana]|uniref:nuclear pore complex protein NUP1 isoform X2 n=1 Tax=Tarenaya hassleriana TaxID=28532 RepID=UPI00053C58D5|nr:PREDICTED: nuclear pore complex protein NUP1 isoform X2 [Tarenaya hassleriana]
MATPARGESNNPYGDGLGAGGKFRKRPSRRPQTTPYDRPPISVRTPGLAGGGGRENGNGGGWISRLVDPAQRLITYSAHRLFASVFRKRLPQGDAPLLLQQQQQVPENVNLEMEGGDSKGVQTLPNKNEMIQVEDTSAFVDRSSMRIKDGFTDLEQILKQKTFTRSEIDRLTTLLHSKAAGSSMGKQEQRAEEINVKALPMPSHDRDQGRTHTMSMENGNQKKSVLTPLGSSDVRDECLASPAELAKAYMGSRPSEVSPSMLGLRGQAGREDSVFLSRTSFPSKSLMMPLVPRSSGKNLLPDNGFVTPRARGRSAVYSMSRTPYSRAQSSGKVGSILPASQSTWEESIPSGSRQGVQMSLKRRISVLDNDMGSVGPVRRIRQKSNLLSRSLALPASGSQHASSPYQQVGPIFTHTSKESAEDIPGPSLNLVPSKSSEMASKILQQLDKLVSTRETSPTKLSPSMIHEPALKSLQHVEAPKFLGNFQEKKLGGSPGSSYQKEDRHKESGSQVVFARTEKPFTAVNTITKTASKNDQDADVKGTCLPATNSMEEHPPKKRAFRMSAHEDLVELDDDHDAASTPPVEVKEKMNASKVDSDTGISKAKWEKPFSSSEVKPLATFVSNGDTSYGTSNGTVATGKSTEIKFTAFATEAVAQGDVGDHSISKFSKGAATEQSIISPAIFSSVEKIDSVKEPRKVTPGMSSVFFSSGLANPFDQKSDAASETNSGKPSFTFGTSEPLTKPPESGKIVRSSASGAGSTTSGSSSLNGSIFSFGAAAASPTPNKGSPPSTPLSPTNISDLPSTSSITQPASSEQCFASTPSTTGVSGNLPASNNKDSSSVSISIPLAPNFSTTQTFKFGESAASLAASTVSSSTDQVSKVTGITHSTFGNLTSIPSGGIASTVPSSGSSPFAEQSSAIKSSTSFMFACSSPAVTDAGSNISGGTSAAAGGSTSNNSITASPAVGSGGSSIFGVTSSWTSATGSNIFAGNSASTTTSSIFGTFPALTSSGSSLFGGTASSTGTGSSIFGFTAGAAASAASSQSQTSNLFGAANAEMGNPGSGTTGSIQSPPFQFGSSASTPTFGLPGSTSTASSSSTFGSSTSGTLQFGTGSNTQLGLSPLAANSASSSSSTTMSTVFGSNWQPSNSTPAFGSSFSSSSTPTFSFGGSSSSATGSSTTAPILGSSASAPSSSSFFTFSSTPAATPSQPVFGSSTPAGTPSQPVFGGSTTGFTFGATPPPAMNGSSNNNDQMSMEDSMAEDTDQAKTSVVPMFGQAAVAPPQHPTFAFGAAATPPSGASPFQFGSQPNNPSPFQASSSLEFNGGGGSFSLGSTGGDKSGRKFIRVNKNRRQKK